MSIRYRILDENGDYSFGRGQQNFTYGIYAVSQAINTRLGLLQGEWWENQEEGLPLFQKILGKSGSAANIRVVDLLMQKRILETQDVISIASFESNYENRTYSFKCKVNTKYGTVSTGTTL